MSTLPVQVISAMAKAISGAPFPSLKSLAKAEAAIASAHAVGFRFVPVALLNEAATWVGQWSGIAGQPAVDLAARLHEAAQGGKP